MLRRFRRNIPQHAAYIKYRLGHGDECIVWLKWTRVCLSRLWDRRFRSTCS